MSSRINTTIAAVEIAITELIAEGGRFSQHAVEIRAGLSNGALNYDCSEYRALKKRIGDIKSSKNKICNTNQHLKEHINKQINLKNKYRFQRDDLRAENIALHAENKELLYQMFKLQQYIKKIEDLKIVDLSAFR